MEVDGKVPTFDETEEVIPSFDDTQAIDDGEKKNFNFPQPLKSDAGTSVSTEGQSAYAPPSIGKIKQNNAKTLNFNKEKVIKDKMREDLLKNTSPAYRQSYVNALVKSGYNKNAVEDFALSVGPAMTEEEAIAQEQAQQKTFAQQIGLGGPNDPMVPVVDWAMDFSKKTVDAATTGLERINKGAAEVLGSLGSQAGGVTDKAKEVTHGALTAATGAAQTAFNVIPQAITFNAAMDAVNTTAQKNLAPEDAKKVEEMTSLPFTIASKIGEAIGINPEEDSSGALFMELLDLAIAGKAIHSATELPGNIRSIADLKDMSQKAAEGKLTTSEQQMTNEYVDYLKTLKLDDIKLAAEKSSTPESKQILEKINTVEENRPVEHDELQTRLAELVSDQEKMAPEFRYVLEPKIEELQKQISDKTTEQINTELEVARREGEVSKIDNDIADLEAQKSQLSPEGQVALNESINALRAQKNDIEQKAVEKELAKLDPNEKVDASVMFAPFYDFTINGIEDAAAVKNSPAYKQYINNVRVIAHNLGVKITGLDETIGGFENAEGNKIVEVSNKLDVQARSMDEVEQLASLISTLTPETQEATIAKRYVDETNFKEHNADEITIPVTDVDVAIKALQEAGINDFAVNESSKTITLLDFIDSSSEKKLEFEEKIINFVNNLNEKGVTNGEPRRQAIESRYIGAEERRTSLKSLESRRVQDSGRLQQGGSVLDSIVQEATRRNERFIAEKAVEKSRSEYADLRSKQLKLADEGMDLSTEELARMKELHKELAPVLEESIKSEERNYENAKAEIESIATKAVGDKGFNLPFGIKKPQRAAIKVLDWYQGQPNKLGDGARTNIIVNDIRHADEIFDIIKKNYEGGIMREETGTTSDYGYPKRLLEVRTKNGRIAEFQVMEPLAYLAKDGLKDFTKETRPQAEKLLQDLRTKLGFKIPDGAGHWFYEIGRDKWVQPELRKAAQEVSKVYYEAFTNPDKYLESGKNLQKMISDFNTKVENADKSKWAKDHMESRPVEMSEKPDTGISQEMRDKQRAELGLPNLPIEDKNIAEHTREALNKEANRQVDTGEVDFNQLAKSIIEDGVTTDDLGKAILNRGAVEQAKKIGEAKLKVDEARANGDLAASERAADEYLQALSDLNNIHKALEIEGTKAGRNLAAMKQSMRDDYSVGSLYTRFKNANNGKPLPQEIIDRLDSYATKIEELDAKIKLAEEAAAKNAKQIEELQKRKPVSDLEKVKQIRKKRSDLFDEWKKYRDSSNDVVKNSPLPIGDKDVVFLAKVVATYAEEGIVTTLEVAKRLKADVKKAMNIKLTDDDINRILNTDIDGKKPIDELVYNGLVGDIKAKKKRLEQIEKDIQNPEEYMARLEQKKADLRKKEGYKSEELRDVEAEIAAANAVLANHLKVERQRIKQKIDAEAGAIEMANRTTGEKIKEGVANVLNVPRSLMASFDFSAPLRQGLVATVAHPSSGWKATKEMFSQAFSQKNFDDWLIRYKLSPEYELAKASELYVADPSELHLNGREEAFMSNLAEKIPFIKHGIKASERGYVGYLNKLRTDVFKNLSDELAKQGKTFESHPEEYKALADYINSTTGRGKLPNKTIEDAAPLLSAALFSPRLIASRINLLNPVYYAKMPKSVRKQAVGDMLKFVGVATTILALADLAGADVEKDPRSSDFAKIKIGDTRYDLLGGFQQYIRAAAQIITGEKKSTADKKIISLNPAKFPYQSRGSIVANFARSKVSPAVGMGIDFLTGRDAVGLPVTWQKELYTHFTPLQLQSGLEAYEKGGLPMVFATLIPSMFGIGVSTYSSGKTKTQLQKEFLKRAKAKD